MTPTTAERHATLITTPSDRELLVTRTFDAPRRLVWDAFTSAEHAPRWMLGPDGWTMPVCEIDLRPGGAWHFVWRKEDGTGMEMNGEYREIDAPHRVVNTERWGEPWPETLNTLVLTEEDGRTVAAQTLLYPSKEARDAVLGIGMAEGIDRSYQRLDEHLRTMA